MQNGRTQLRAWIERRGITQQDAAGIIGMDQVSLSYVLSGKRTPGLANATKIERATGIVTEAWLQNQISDSATDEPTPARKRVR